MTRILVYTCQDYAWCLKPLLYLLDVYWSREQPIVIGGCKPFDMPDNVTWLDVESRVAERWSDGLIECLHQMDDDVFVWMLEDYWLCRTTDCTAISSLAEYMRGHPDVLKIDLTADRAYSGAAVDIDPWGRCDLIETSWDMSYQWSTQAAIWDRKHLLNHLHPEMSPWDFELRDAKPRELRVLGTRQWPLRYVNGVGMGLEKDEYRTEHIRHGVGGTTIERIPDEHVQFMQEHGLFPADRKLNNDINR
jgi:hypothetical protein